MEMLDIYLISLSIMQASKKYPFLQNLPSLGHPKAYYLVTALRYYACHAISLCKNYHWRSLFPKWQYLEFRVWQSMSSMLQPTSSWPNFSFIIFRNLLFQQIDLLTVICSGLVLLYLYFIIYGHYACSRNLLLLLIFCFLKLMHINETLWHWLYMSYKCNKSSLEGNPVSHSTNIYCVYYVLANVLGTVR